jgi:hypothetical protein
MIAVPAQAILRQDGDGFDTPAAVVVAEAPSVPAGEGCTADADAAVPSVETILARLELDRETVQADLAAPLSPSNGPATHELARFAFQPLAIALF